MSVKQLSMENHIPLIAIIRGVTPEKVLDVAQVLIDEGFTMIEVPLNSPNAIESIQKLVDKYGTSDYFIGAGTVTTPEKAKQVIATGANLVVTPNFNAEVTRLSAEAGCATFPGVVTPSEAFSAIEAGASGLKIFPVSVLGLDGFKALKSVLPPDAMCFPVGGISPTEDSMKPFLDIGAKGFGLGAALYTPTMSLDEIRENAQGYIAAYKRGVAA